MPATDPLPVIVARLDELRPAMLFGYPTVLARIAQAGLSFTPMAVTSVSETLTPELRAIIRDGLGAPIVDSYATTEGLTGTSGPDDDVIMLAEDSCIVEVLEDRVLVTNLGNRVQPLIRYELNDRMTVVSTDGLVRVRVEGRADPVLRYGDVGVHPIAIRSELVRTPAVLDYQVRQTAGGVDLEVLAPVGVDAGICAPASRGRWQRPGLRRPAVARPRRRRSRSTPRDRQARAVRAAALTYAGSGIGSRHGRTWCSATSAPSRKCRASSSVSTKGQVRVVESRRPSAAGRSWRHARGRAPDDLLEQPDRLDELVEVDAGLDAHLLSMFTTSSVAAIPVARPLPQYGQPPTPPAVVSICSSSRSSRTRSAA